MAAFAKQAVCSANTTGKHARDFLKGVEVGAAHPELDRERHAALLHCGSVDDPSVGELGVGNEQHFAVEDGLNLGGPKADRPDQTLKLPV